jgi:hypothetical protein
VIKISEEEYSEMVFGLGSPGVCISCGYLDEYAGCEPDARDYFCPDCEQNTLYGLEEALLMGELDFE